MFALDPTYILPAILACALGGVLKGATGAGAPVVGVPVLAALFDVQLAVAVFVVPNLLTNLWQAWQYRGDLMPWPFVILFSGGGAFGALIGTYLLAGLPSDILSMAMAVVVFLYIGFRILKADWVLAYGPAIRLAAPIGVIGGVMQGATGISAPASLTFLNALKLPRLCFVATVSVFFCVMSVAQIERLASLGLMSWERFGLGLLATFAILMSMPLGNALARRISQVVFDRVILLLLAVIAVKVMVEALLG